MRGSEPGTAYALRVRLPAASPAFGRPARPSEGPRRAPAIAAFAVLAVLNAFVPACRDSATPPGPLLARGGGARPGERPTPPASPGWTTPRADRVVPGALAPPAPIELSPAPTQPVAFVELPRPAAPPPPAPAPLLARRYRDGGRLVVLRADDPLGTRRELLSSFVGVRDPTPSLDGTEILFSGKEKPGSRWQIWSLPAAGGQPRRLFDQATDCFHPAVHFGGRVTFAATVDDATDTTGGRATTALFVGEPDSGFVQRVTYGVGPAIDPIVLPDGRTGFAALRRVGGETLPLGRALLFACNWDGTNYTALQGLGAPPRMRLRPAVLDGDLLAFLGSDDPGDVEGGELYLTSFLDPYPPARRLTDPQAAPGRRGEGRFAAVSDLGGGLLVASYRRAPSEPYGLWLVARDSGARRELLSPAKDRELVDVVALRKSPHFLGRLTGVQVGMHWGWIYCQDARRLGGSLEGTTEPRRIERVRVIEGRPLPPRAPERGGGGEGAALSIVGSPPVMAERILGELPLATDGSFFAKVPADRPLRLQLLDRTGVAVVSEQGWQWVRPNQARGCVGCHVGGDFAPRNRRLAATIEGAVDLTAPPSRAIDYVHDIGPAMGRSCAVSRCHVGASATGGRDFSPLFGDNACRRATDGATFPCPRGFQTLLSPRAGVRPAFGGALVHPGSAVTSPLVWMLYGRQLAPQQDGAPFPRPLGQKHPPGAADALRALIARWVDLGAALDVRAPEDKRP